jgi:RNase adapter protein RapZ
VALGIDVRVRGFLQEAVAAIDKVRSDYDFSLLFLDASTAMLEARFNSTRRPHPLRAMAARTRSPLGVAEGVKIERERLVPLRERATLVLDTSDMTVHALRAKVLELFRDRAQDGMLVRFLSFGFKYGPPKNCDTLFDVRFLQNPYFIPALAHQSGLDEPVREFVQAQGDAQEFRDRIVDLLKFLVPRYEAEGKSYLTIGFGCTGGRHRSVSMAEWVARGVSEGLQLRVEVEHRDLGRSELAETESKSVSEI